MLFRSERDRRHRFAQVWEEIGRDVLFRRDREELRRPRALALIRRARVR